MQYTLANYHIPLHLPDAQPRSPGIHLSGILRELAIGMKLFKADDSDLDMLIADTEYLGTEPRLLLLAMGLSWEDWLLPRLPRVQPHPGEFSKNGIIGTPDGLEFRRGQPPLLHEAKATYKSFNWDFDHHQLYLWQGAGYLAMLSEVYGVPCTECVFHVWHVRGDYKSRFPLMQSVVVTFDQQEVEDYWGMIERHKYLAVPEKGSAAE